ncbi:MAG: Calx-beta domain-containing protein [Rubripirellula sp.]
MGFFKTNPSGVLKHVFPRRKKIRPARRAKRCRPQFQQLEDRRVLAAMIDAGGPYNLDTPMRELVLMGTAMPDPGGMPGPLNIEWDLNNDNVFGDAGVTMENGLVPFIELQNLGIATVGNHTIRMRASDINGVVGIDSATLTISNQAPISVEAGFPGLGYGPVQVGESVFLMATAHDMDDELMSLTYEWDLNNDGAYTENITGENATVSHATMTSLGFVAGLNPIRVKVTDPFGASLVSETTTIDYVAITPPFVDAGGPYNLNSPMRELMLMGTASNSGPTTHPLIIDWDLNSDGVFGDGNVIMATASVPFIELQTLGIATVGDHTIRMRAIDVYGAVGIDSATLTISNQAPISVDAGPPGLGYGPVQLGQSVSLFATANDMDDDPMSLTYEWDLNNDGAYTENIIGESPAVSYATMTSLGLVTGLNPIRVKVTDPFGASLVSNVTNIDFVATDPPIASIGGPYNYFGSPITLDASGSTDPDAAVAPGVLAFAWDLDNDGQFDDAATATVSIDATALTNLGITTAGDYTITVRVTDEYGANSMATTTLSLSSTPPPPPAGTLDTSFGIGGRVITDFAAANDVALSVAEQADGQLVVLARKTDGTSSSILIRYNPDGSRDLTFGAGGEAAIPFYATKMVLAPNGTLLVAGEASGFAVSRFSANGLIDAGFGTAGQATKTVGTMGDMFADLEVQADGKILLAGSSLLGIVDGIETTIATIVRFNANGTVDSSFATNGVMTTNSVAFGGHTFLDTLEVFDLALQPDGQMILGVSGQFQTGFGLARYSASGTLDATFGNGIDAIPDAYVEARSIALQADGKILVAGNHTTGTSKLALLRFLSDGSIDSGFGHVSGMPPNPEAGLVTTAFPGSTHDDVTRVRAQANGRIVVVGGSFQSAGTQIALARYDEDGFLDDVFFGNGNGLVTTSMPGTGSTGIDFIFQNYGQILVAGRTITGSDNSDIALVRYHSESTQPNTPPVANAGGPYNVVEGSSFVLDALGTTDAEQNNTELTYQWDFNLDGAYDDATGPQPTFIGENVPFVNPNVLDGPSTIIVGLRVIDAGGLSSISTATISIANAPPVIMEVNSTSPTPFGLQSSVSIMAHDPWSFDTLTYAFDFDNDGNYEESGTSSSRLHTFATLGDHTVGVRVSDDDGGVATSSTVVTVLQSIQYSLPTQEVNEQDGDIPIAMTLSHPLAVPLTLELTVASATAAAADYTFTQRLVTFAAGETTASTSLHFIDDGTFDPTRTITLGVTPLSGPFSTYASINGAADSHTITILDNDPLPTVRFNTATQRHPEQNATHTLDVELSYSYGEVVTVPIYITGNAQRGFDYTITGVPDNSSIHNIVIPAGETKVTLSLNVLDDSGNEGVERATFTMLAPTNAEFSTDTDSPTVHTFLIELSDIQPISFTTATRPAITELDGFSEITAVTITAEMPNYPQHLVASVPLNFSGSATLGVDYAYSNAAGTAIDRTSSVPPVMTFTSQVGEYTFYILSDIIPEETEFINIAMGTPEGVVLGSVTRTQVEIRDDDDFYVRFDNDEVHHDLWEDSGTFTVTASLNNEATAPITVPVSAGTNLGSDFTLSSEAFVFPIGSRTASLQLTVINDSISESLRENASLFLHPPTGVRLHRDAWGSYAHNAIGITILDDDPIVQIARTGGSNGGTLVLGENGSKDEYRFSLSHPTNKPVSFQYTVGGNVTADDYTTTELKNNQTITIPAGSTKATGIAKISMITDGVAERGEFYNIRVDSPTNAVGSVSPDVKVTDNDKASIQFTTASRTVSSGAQTITLDITPSVALTQTAFIPVEIIRSSTNAAEQGRNYNLPEMVFFLYENSPNAAIPLEILGGEINVDTTVKFRLRAGSGYLLGENDEMTLTIRGKAPIVSPGTIPLSDYIEPIDETNSDKGLGQIISTSTTVINETAVGADKIAIGIPAQGEKAEGLVAGSSVYFDANKNYLYDDGEIATLTRVDGQFSITIPASFDTNDDGLIDTSEGQFVAFGGIDASTGLSLPTRYVAPVGGFVLSPLSTVAAELVNSHDFETTAAYARIASAMRLPSSELVDLRTFQAIRASAAGDANGLRVFAANAQVQNTVTQLATFAASLAGAPPLSMLADYIFADIARRMLNSELLVQLANPLLTSVLLESVLTNHGLEVPSATIDGVGNIVADGNGTIEDILELMRPDAAEQITRVQKAAQENVAAALAEVAAGTTPIQTAVTANTGTALDAQHIAAVVGDVVPPTVTISPVTMYEGSGQSMAVFDVTINQASTKTVTLDYNTYDVTATAGDDYATTNGTLTWEPGDTSPRTIKVPIQDDHSFESDEAFVVRLSSVTNALVNTLSVSGTLVNDDLFFYQAELGTTNEMVLEFNGDSMQFVRNGELIAAGTFSYPLPITIYGADGSDTLKIIAETADSITKSGNVISVEGQPISYLSIDELTLPPDLTPPTATVMPLASTTDTDQIEVQVNLADLTSGPGEFATGVSTYDLYVAYDDGPWTFYQADIPASQTTVMVEAQSDRRHWFRAVAVDGAALREIESTSPFAESSTRVLDIAPPVTFVSSHLPSSSSGQLYLSMEGSDAGIGLKEIQVYVSVDDESFVPIANSPIPAGMPTSGVYKANVTYQGLRDGMVHTYHFYSLGVDRRGNIESYSEATPVRTLTTTFALSAALSLSDVSVQNQQTQRSYISNVDLVFNNIAGVSTLASSGRLKIERFDVNATTIDQGTGTLVTGVDITTVGNVIKLDFGAAGASDGMYRVWMDLDGDTNGTFESHADFFRLLGDSNGDGRVDRSDQLGITEDLDGNGRVDSRDRLAARRASGNRLGSVLEDYFFQP